MQLVQSVQATLILTRRTKGTSLSGLASHQAGHDQTVVHLWRSPSPATRRRSTAEQRWLRELAENEELTVRRLACGVHAECMMRALGNSVLRECVMGSSRQGQQLLCHGQQPVRGNNLSWATAYMSGLRGNGLSGATARQGQQPVRSNCLPGASIQPGGTARWHSQTDGCDSVSVPNRRVTRQRERT